MYKNLIGEEVILIVSSRSEQILEYRGTIKDYNGTELVLSNASVNYLAAALQKNLFGSNVINLQDDKEEIIINVKYIISCTK